MDSSIGFWLSYLRLFKKILVTSIGLGSDFGGFSYWTFRPFWVDLSVASRHRPTSLFIVCINCNLRTYCATANNRIILHRISNRD